ncbi:PREDICTED: putative F-box protein At1g53550 [Camelina sativa]|uniref:F-box protein At1g53550 n=1 Tax=Camelina sativa TaxID=90675 RepID=A0ABM0YJL9_CAMSA|nr:PREDICTED: putative F-box protein At1g53550 [Camelina sativa]
MFISSSPQPQNPDKYQSLVATLHTRSATDYCSKICPPVNGLVCRQYTGEDHIYAVISNPITGEYVRTPEVTREAIHTSREKTCFGYDPIEKQFKQSLTKKVPSFALTLKNAEEHNWSDHFYKMPEVMHPTRIKSVFSAGMIGSGEVVLYPIYSHNSLYILYYNLEKNIITSVSVEVPGLDYAVYHEVQTFPNFVEDVKLM